MRYTSAYQIWSKSDNSDWDKDIMLFSKWRPLPSWICENCHFGQVTDICLWFFISILKFSWIGQYGAEILPKNGFQYGVRLPYWIWKISNFFVKFPCSGWSFVSVYQIWSKSVNSWLRYGDTAIFKMAAVRHLEFAENAVLVKWPISAWDPSSLFQISRWSANMAPRYSKKTIFNMASVHHLEFEKKSNFLSNSHSRNGNLHRHTKFDRYRIIETEIWR